MKKVFEVKNESELVIPATYAKEYLQNGGVMLLKGDLGYGKTAFVRSFCALLGCEEDVASPTYTIMNEYKSEPRIFHYDFYNSGADVFFSKFMFEYLIKLLLFCDPSHWRSEFCNVIYADRSNDDIKMLCFKRWDGLNDLICSEARRCM